MASINDLYPSRWFVCADLKRKPGTFTIERIEVGKVGQGAEAKPQLIVNFHEIEKPLGLNKTNAVAIGNVYGEDYEEWVGEPVVLFPTRVDFSGKMVDAIRVDEHATREIMQAKLRSLKASAKSPAVTGKVRPVTQAEIDAEESGVAEDDISF